MKKTRAFICIDFPEEIIKEVARIHELLGKQKFAGKFTELENLHLTLKFLGDIEPEILEKVQEKLKTIKLEKFEARLGEIGTFSYYGKPRIVWIKVFGKGIIELQKKVDEILKDFGFAKEERFMSHLTIARIKYIKDLEKFYNRIKTIKVKPIKFYVEEFKLMSSKLDKIGPKYEVVEKFEV